MSKTDRIDNSLLREAFCNSRITAAQLAGNLDFYKRRRNGDTPDTQRVLLMLGLKKCAGKKHGGKYYKSMTYSNALKFVDAMYLDPVDVDL